jgi:hypothetical protein
LITLLVEFKQMKLAVMATAIFNNLLFHKQSFPLQSTMT